MTRTSGSIGGVSAAALARVGAPVPMVESATPANLLAWATARGKLRTGAADVARIAFVGDSKTVGAGAGTGSNYSVGAFARSRPARVAALLAAGGLNVRTDAFFGTAGMATVADALAYDPRRSGFSGWGGGLVSLGGVALTTLNANPGSFQPGGPVDRCSIFYHNRVDRASIAVAKGAESVTITPTAAAPGVLTRAEVTFATRDNAAITVTRSTGSGNVHLVGMVAWDSSKPGVEIANLGVYGVVTAYQADMTNAYSPANALAIYAPHLTVVNLGTNDLGQGVAMATWLAGLRVIIAQAKASGSVILCWPAVGGASPTFGADAVRGEWRSAARALALETGCLFIDEEALLGGRAVAHAGGAFADGVHESAWAYDVQAAAIARAIL
jgi:lysophospholipase L1-like esterase